MPLSSTTPYALYLASAIGAIGLYILLRAGPARQRMAGTLIALAGLAILVFVVLRLSEPAGGIWGIPVVPALLGLIALSGATRMVTHPKPVFAALYFVLVVISSAGLFLVLQAEFMAFALVIVYAGAILITYMFVLMLAQQSQAEGGHDIEAGTLYDRLPREPLAAIAVGFLLLATLGDALFGPRSGFTATTQTKVVDEANVNRWLELRTMPRRVDRFVEAQLPGAVVTTDERGPLVQPTQHGTSAVVAVRTVEDGVTKSTTLTLPPEAAPTNTQSVGLALVSRFPASLELASVILLMAMFGAAILARKQIELGEDERREAAGMRRISVDEPEPPSQAGSISSFGGDLTASRGGRP